MTTAPVIHVDHVDFAYHNTSILRDVCIDIKQGEKVGVIGPNGGGKTTLLKLLLGFLTPTTGAIRILGTTPEEARRYVGYVPQGLLYDRKFPISVMELVLQGTLLKSRWWGGYSSAAKETALLQLEKLELVDKRNAQFGTLSGGQRQRALIARALVSKPQILFLDEPTANVDPQAELEIYQLLQKLNQEVTILMVTHNLSTVIQQVSKVLCVQGEARTLSPEEVCKHFAVGLYHPPLLPQNAAEEDNP